MERLTGVADRTVIASQSLMSSSKVYPWETWPTETMVKKHINEFIEALSKADFQKAFTLCPVKKTWKKPGFFDPSEPTFPKFVRKFVEHALFSAIDGQECMEDFEDEIEPSKPESWCRFITPPGKLGYADLALTMPDKDSEGEVLANVALNDEISDITGRYELVLRDEKWVLSFSNFDVM